MNRAKIKIMNSKPELTDDEIRQFMDFEDLLAKHKMAIRPSPLNAVLRYGLPAVGITAAVLWFTMTRHPEEPLDAVPVDVSAAPPASEPESKGIVIEKEPNENTPENVLPAEETPAANDVVKSQTPARSAQRESSETSVTTKGESNAPITVEATPPAYQQAEPVDGYSSLYDYFSANLVYPPENVKDSVEGVQTVKFIINTDGKPENIEIVNSLGPQFEMEAKRVIESMPRWQPALLNGNPVPSQISLPVTFRINKVTTKE